MSTSPPLRAGHPRGRLSLASGCRRQAIPQARHALCPCRHRCLRDHGNQLLSQWPELMLPPDLSCRAFQDMTAGRWNLRSRDAPPPLHRWSRHAAAGVRCPSAPSAHRGCLRADLASQPVKIRSRNSSHIVLRRSRHSPLSKEGVLSPTLPQRAQRDFPTGQVAPRTADRMLV